MNHAEHNINSEKWWNERKSILPHLSELACKYLPITATSTPSERLFSNTGNHISIRRTRLDPNLLHRMIFLK